MIAFHLGPAASLITDLPFIRSLEFTGRRRAVGFRTGDALAAQLLPAGATARTAALRPPRSASGRLALVNGYLANPGELATRLGLPAGDDASLYAAAVDRWGDAADRHIVGHYCAISWREGERRLRLSRSPLDAPPLHYRHGSGSVTASSAIRSLLVIAGGRESLDLGKLGDSLYLNFEDEGRGWYDGHRRVPLGTVVEVDAESVRQTRYYDPLDAPDVRLPRDEDYVEAALELLDEATAAALRGFERPGIALSGGLDSAQVAASALRLLPLATVLHGFTYLPESGWEGAAPPGTYASERAAVERFAAANPRLVAHFETNDGLDFRHRSAEMIAAMGCAPPGLAHAFPFHFAFERARGLGCDVMLTGDFGNESISSDGRWGLVEYFRSGRWGELRQALKHRNADPRSLLRKFLSLSLLPLMPERVWEAVMAVRHGGAPDVIARRTGLRRGWADANRVVERGRAAGYDPRRYPAISRRQWQALSLQGAGHEVAEVWQGFEQLYDIPRRDPTAHRPLVEFCFGLPTDQYLRGGLDRWLARRMAKGRLPEAQRLNRDVGRHELDWQRRIGRAAPALIEEARRLAADPDIAAMFDIERLIERLGSIPAKPVTDRATTEFYQLAVPRTMTAARFVAWAKGRNDL